MRKSIFGLLALMMVFLFSCTDDKTGSGIKRDGMVDFAIKASIPQGIKTYASENGGATNVDATKYDLRYIMEVRNLDGTVAYRDYQIVSSDFNSKGVTFNVRLLAKQYDFVFWADFVLKSSAGHDDLYYKTSDCADATKTQDDIKADLGLIGEGLIDIQMLSNVATDNAYGLSNEARDAYFHEAIRVDLSTTDAMQSVTLTRPFGKYRLIATDAPQNLDFTAGTTKLGDVTIDYAKAMGTAGAKVPYIFNALTGEVDLDNLIPVTAYAAPSDIDLTTMVGGIPYTNVYVLASDYVFAPKDGASFPVAFDATVYDKSLKVAGVKQVGDRDISLIPIQRNKLTTVIGNFFTNTAVMQVIVDDAFVNGEDVESADISQDITDLYTIIIPDGSSPKSPLSYVFTGNISDGAVITIKEETLGDYTGEINLAFTKSNNATIYIITPNAKVNLLGTVGTVNSTTAGHTLVVLKNSNIGTLNILGGSVEIYGNVGTLNPNSGKVYWGVSNAAELAAAVAKPAPNDGIVFANNITDNTCLIIAKDNYVLDGKGFSYSGAFTKIDPMESDRCDNAILVKGNNDTIRNLTVTNTVRNGITVYSPAIGVVLDNLNLKNNGGGGVIVNGAKVTANNTTSSGNKWGYTFNVAKGSSATTDPLLKLGGVNHISDAIPVYAESNVVSQLGTNYISDVPNHDAASWVQGEGWEITNITFTPAEVKGTPDWAGKYNYSWAENPSKSISNLFWRNDYMSPETWNVGADYLTLATRPDASSWDPDYYAFSGLQYWPKETPTIDVADLVSTWSVKSKLYIDNAVDNTTELMMVYVVDATTLDNPYVDAQFVSAGFTKNGATKYWRTNGNVDITGSLSMPGNGAHDIEITCDGTNISIKIDGTVSHTRALATPGNSYPVIVSFYGANVLGSSYTTKWGYPEVTAP